MGRNKKEVTKDIYIRFRVTKKIKEEYFKYCNDNNINSSKQLRDFIEQLIQK